MASPLIVPAKLSTLTAWLLTTAMLVLVLTSLMVNVSVEYVAIEDEPTSEGQVPAHTCDNVTDRLHSAFEFRTGYEIITSRQIR